MSYKVTRSTVLHRVYATHDKGAHKPTNDVLMQCFKETLTLFHDHPTYIIMDALDECPNTFGMPSPREVVSSGNVNIARLLPARGADVGAEDYWGRTAYQIASDNRHEVAQLLSAHGAESRT